MKSKSNMPPKWTDIYPQGTSEGDEEQAVFCCLARHHKWKWRSVAQMAAETHLTKERVEKILQKYYKKGMVFQHPQNEDSWGYWERIIDEFPQLIPKTKYSITEVDQKNRISKIIDD